MKGGHVVTETRTHLVDDFSLEMTGKDVDKLREAAHAIPQGTAINITFRGNEDLSMRVGAAPVVLEECFVPVPHISARRVKSRAELREFLDELKRLGASEHVFIIGGDPKVTEGPVPDSLSVNESGLLTDFE